MVKNYISLMLLVLGTTLLYTSSANETEYDQPPEFWDETDYI